MGYENTQNGFQRVLFEIDAFPDFNNKKPFASISGQECEVLFTLGSIFRLNSIHSNNNQLWTIHLTLCKDDEHHLKLVFDQMRAQNGSGETNLTKLAKFLSKMGKFDLAEKYYLRLIKEVPSDHPSLITLYEELDHIALQKGDFDQSLQWQQKLLSLKQQTDETTKSHSKLSRSKLYSTEGDRKIPDFK